jgi:hypothetical protein
MGDVQISDEVAGIVTADNWAWIDYMTASDEPYECPRCERPGTVRATRTSVVLLCASQPGITVLALAHQACLPSRVYHGDEIGVIPTCEMALYAWVARDGAAPHAQGLLDLSATATISTAAGEDVDLVLSSLLGDGMGLATSAEAVLPVSDRIFMEFGDSEIVIWRRTSRGRSAWHVGPMGPRLGRWRRVAETEGMAELVIGSQVIPPAEDGSGILPFLTEAMRAGRLVGARVPVIAPQLSPREEHVASRDPADSTAPSRGILCQIWPAGRPPGQNP